MKLHRTSSRDSDELRGQNSKDEYREGDPHRCLRLSEVQKEKATEMLDSHFTEDDVDVGNVTPSFLLRSALYWNPPQTLHLLITATS